MKISDLIFYYEKEWVLKKEFQIWFLTMKRMSFKERISYLIFNYEKEWVLKKEFQIWFLIMKKMSFKERILDLGYLITNDHRSKII